MEHCEGQRISFENCWVFRMRFLDNCCNPHFAGLNIVVVDPGWSSIRLSLPVFHPLLTLETSPLLLSKSVSVIVIHPPAAQYLPSLLLTVMWLIISHQKAQTSRTFLWTFSIQGNFVRFMRLLSLSLWLLSSPSQIFDFRTISISSNILAQEMAIWGHPTLPGPPPLARKKAWFSFVQQSCRQLFALPFWLFLQRQFFSIYLRFGSLFETN